MGPFAVCASQDLRTGAGPSTGRVCCRSNHWGCPKGSGRPEGVGSRDRREQLLRLQTISGAPCHWLVLVLWGQLWLPVWHASPQGRLRLTPLLQGAHRCLLGPPKQEVIIADPGWRNSAGFPKARVQFLRIPGTELPNPEPRTPNPFLPTSSSLLPAASISERPVCARPSPWRTQAGAR